MLEIIDLVDETSVKISYKEVHIVYYNEISLVRRVILDQQNNPKQMFLLLNKLELIWLRNDILRRGLLINEFDVNQIEKLYNHFERDYIDTTVADYKNFIIGNFRRGLTFSYFTWKIIE